MLVPTTFLEIAVSYFSQRYETSLLRVTCQPQLATQFCENGPIRARLLLAGDFKLVTGERVVNTFQLAPCKLRKKILRTYDTPSATCNVFHSSSLHCKLREKLPRVTWPLGPPQTREIVIDNYLYSTTKTSRKLLVVDRALPHTRGQNYL